MGKNDVEVIVLNGIKWLNEKHIEEGLEHANVAAITLKYPLKHRKQRQELINCGNYQPCRRFLKEKLATKIIMDCRAAAAVDFRNRLGFNPRTISNND